MASFCLIVIHKVLIDFFGAIYDANEKESSFFIGKNNYIPCGLIVFRGKVLQ